MERVRVSTTKEVIKTTVMASVHSMPRLVASPDNIPQSYDHYQELFVGRPETINNGSRREPLHFGTPSALQSIFLPLSERTLFREICKHQGTYF